MAISFDTLRSFSVIAEELNFSRAAERLNITQPPLTRQIQRLEQLVGAQLLDRSPRHVHLTPAGEAFLREANAMLGHLEDASDAARRIHKGIGGRIRIGFTSTAAASSLPRFLEVQRRAFPGIEVSLSEHVSRELEERIHNHRLDVALLRRIEDTDGLQSQVIVRERMLAAIPIDHPLANDVAPISVGELAGEPLIQYSSDSAKYLHDITAQILREVRVATRRTVTQVWTMCSLVSADEGIGLVPESAMRIPFPRVRFRPLAEAPDPIVELLAAMPTRSPHPAIATMIRLAFHTPDSVEREISDTHTAS